LASADQLDRLLGDDGDRIASAIGIHPWRTRSMGWRQKSTLVMGTAKRGVCRCTLL
jgi:hypothetical protein